MAKNGVDVATDADEFADLLPDTATADKQVKNEIDDWEGPIPESALQWAKIALANPDQRVELPWRGEEVAARLRSALRAAVKSLDPTKVAYTRPLKNTGGDITKFSFTVGAPRGRKSATSEKGAA
jgi:hypothetical protein